MDTRRYYSYLVNRSRLSLCARRFFVKDLASHFQGLVLDVGCGIGEFLRLYADSVGIDRNPYAVEHCIQAGLCAVLGHAQNLPFEDGAFEGVLASNVLEHLEDVEAVVTETVRVLKPGGVLLVSVPLEAGFSRDPTHVQMLREADLRALAQRVGLRTKRVYRYPFRAMWPGKYLYFCELRAVFVK